MPKPDPEPTLWRLAFMAVALLLLLLLTGPGATSAQAQDTPNPKTPGALTDLPPDALPGTCDEGHWRLRKGVAAAGPFDSVDAAIGAEMKRLDAALSTREVEGRRVYPHPACAKARRLLHKQALADGSALLLYQHTCARRVDRFVLIESSKTRKFYAANVNLVDNLASLDNLATSWGKRLPHVYKMGFLKSWSLTRSPGSSPVGAFLFDGQLFDTTGGGFTLVGFQSLLLVGRGNDGTWQTVELSDSDPEVLLKDLAGKALRCEPERREPR